MPQVTFTDLAIRKITKPGRYGFGRGYFGLCIEASVLSDGRLSKTWGQRIYVKGMGKEGKAKAVDLGLGKYPMTSVADVRKWGETNAAFAAKGIDPRERLAGMPTFRVAALQWIEDMLEGRKREIASQILTDHCFPHIGDKRVDKVVYGDLDFVNSLWLIAQPTAIKLISYMSDVFDRCEMKGYIERSLINSVFRSQLPRNRHEIKHQPALEFGLLPEAIAAIDQRTRFDIATRACVKAIMLTGLRSHSVILAEWSEICWKEIHGESDWNGKGWEPVDWNEIEGSTKTVVWCVPGEHMKGRKPFVVPVSSGLLEILKEMRGVRGQGKRNPTYIFAGVLSGNCVSRGPLMDLLRSLGYPSDTEGRCPTLHGFRSTLSTWAEKHDVPRKYSEAALSHEPDISMGSTYMRWDHLESRARLMQAYADYAMGRLAPGWVWIEPEVEAKIEAERRRADEAERELAVVSAELAQLKNDSAEMMGMLRDIWSRMSVA